MIAGVQVCGALAVFLGGARIRYKLPKLLHLLLSNGCGKHACALELLCGVAV